MALSDYEQRVLDEIERNLTAGAPGVVASIGPRRSRILSVGLAMSVLVGLGFVVLGLVVAGAIGITVAVVGFVLIVAGCWAALRACRGRRRTPPRGLAA